KRSTQKRRKAKTRYDEEDQIPGFASVLNRAEFLRPSKQILLVFQKTQVLGGNRMKLEPAIL
ncbi:hypothetical protein WDW37_16375, partial [Bdellovibrionota bacterium FG-1]